MSYEAVNSGRDLPLATNSLVGGVIVGSGLNVSSGTISTINNGTVTSVAATVPTWLTISGSPITTSGTLAITATTGQTANSFLATPNGTTGAVNLRTIVAADIPTLNQNTTGSAGSFTGSLSGDVTGTQSATIVGKINGTSLAGLSTGILKNTTSTGVPSIAVAGTDYASPTSGTSILYGNGSGGFSNVTVGSGLSFTSGTLAATGGGGGGSAETETITQSNSFTVGQVIYFNGTSYVLAQANTPATAEAIGVISAASGTQFTVTYSGRIAGLTGLTAGQVYYLSDTTAGLLQTTEPVTIGTISKPMLITTSTTSGLVVEYRGNIINGPPATYSQPVVGMTRNLIGSGAGSAKTASWSCDEIVVETSLGGTAYKGSALTTSTLAFNGTGTGTGGMDTGATPTSGSLYIYAIYNPTTNAWSVLGTTAGSGASIYGGSNLPSGYTASALLWCGVTDASGNIQKFNQLDRYIFFPKINVLSITTSVPTTFTSLSISLAVPANSVKSITGIVGTPSGAGGSANIAVAADSGGTAETMISSVRTSDPGTNPLDSFQLGVQFTLPIITQQTVYYKTIGSTQPARIDISGFTF